MKCLVVDDEPVALEILKDYIAKIPFLQSEGFFRDPLKAVDFLKDNDVDLLFLDINMPDLTGIQFLKTLKKPPLAVFTTAYSEYALESYDYDAVDYLLKPIEFDRFLKAVNKAHELFQMKTSLPENREHILLKSGTDYFKIKTADIYYIRGTGNYVTFVTEKKEILSLMTMKHALEILPSSRFFRIHKSFIINFQHVDRIETEQVKIQDEYLPIGDSYKDDFFDTIKK
jgi:DNA-binding LytR/AlgR family response regulator